MKNLEEKLSRVISNHVRISYIHTDMARDIWVHATSIIYDTLKPICAIKFKTSNSIQNEPA